MSDLTAANLGIGGGVAAIKSIQTYLDRLEQHVWFLERMLQFRQSGFLHKTQRGVGVFEANIRCHEDVGVLTGPLVGRVDGTTAVILLEVDKDAKVELIVTCQDSNNCRRELKRLSVMLVARRPCVVTVRELLPCTCYAVLLSGVKIKDAVSRSAEFRTGRHSKETTDDGTRFVAVATDCYLNSHYDIWSMLRPHLTTHELQAPNFMIHMGGPPGLADSFRKAWHVLVQHIETRADAVSSLHTVEPWEVVEDNITELLRAPYRLMCNLTGTREVLSRCPVIFHLGSPGIRFPFPSRLSPDLRRVAATSMSRIATRVHCEFQRQLLDPTIHQVLEHEDVILQLRGCVATAQLQLARCHLDHKSGKAVARCGREVDVSNGFRVESFPWTSKAESTARGAISEAANNLASVLSTQPGLCTAEHAIAWHRFGATGVIVLDVGLSFWDGENGVASRETNALMRSDWTQLDSLLMYTAIEVTTLIITVDNPLIDSTSLPDQTGSHASDLISHVQTTTNVQTTMHGQDYRARLLQMLVAWLRVSRRRSLLIVTRGSGDGGALDAEFHDGVVMMRQVVLQPTSDYHKLHPVEGALPVRLAKRRWNLKPSRGAKYLECFITRKSNSLADMQTRVHSTLCSKTHVMLGPIIGIVKVSMATILLEVSTDAIVACVLVDTLTGQRITQSRHLTGREPTVFVFHRLAHGRLFRVQFDGIYNVSSHCGSLSTQRKCITSVVYGQEANYLSAPCAQSLDSTTSVSFLAFGPEARALPCRYNGKRTAYDTIPTAGILKRSNTEYLPLWSQLHDKIVDPVTTTDVVLHVGGRVDVLAIMPYACALLIRAEQAVSRGDSLAARHLEHAALDKLRDAYRTQWNLPQVRTALAHGSHLIVPGDGELGKAFVHWSQGAKIEVDSCHHHSIWACDEVVGILQRHAVAVMHDYVRQLWQPIVLLPASACSSNLGDEIARTQIEGPGVKVTILDDAACTYSYPAWETCVNGMNTVDFFFQQWAGGRIGMLGTFGTGTNHQQAHDGCWQRGLADTTRSSMQVCPWLSLQSILTQPQLRTLILTSETSFGLFQLLFQPRCSACDSLRTSLARSDASELLVHLLSNWKLGGSNREIIAVCGGQVCAFLEAAETVRTT
mmetsp:Transcript_24963/g.99140  ORF Transcript_24963/g.99140 Transcript_24963/m.99140 type:complete len:1130 (+) Transcript_24963:107-3496(+)